MNLIVGVYTHPDTRKSYVGWVEPPEGNWIAFVAPDGSASFWDRNPDGSTIDPPSIPRYDGDQLEVSLEALRMLADHAEANRPKAAAAAGEQRAPVDPGS